MLAKVRNEVGAHGKLIWFVHLLNEKMELVTKIEAKDEKSAFDMKACINKNSAD